MKDGDCTVYVKHLLAEHRRLDKLVRQTLSTFPSWEEHDITGWLPRLIAGLTAIKGELAQHFREEEAGGCLEEAVARLPALAAEAQHVQDEHPQILQQIDELVAQCRQLDRPTPADARSLQLRVQELVHRLRGHEARENKIIERGFATVLENEDAAEEEAEPVGPE